MNLFASLPWLQIPPISSTLFDNEVTRPPAVRTASRMADAVALARGAGYRILRVARREEFPPAFVQALAASADADRVKEEPGQPRICRPKLEISRTNTASAHPKPPRKHILNPASTPNQFLFFLLNLSDRVVNYLLLPGGRRFARRFLASRYRRNYSARDTDSTAEANQSTVGNRRTASSMGW